MKKVLSYCIWGTEPRYWSNIPYIIVANSALYDGFTMRFFVHKGCDSSEWFKLLLDISQSPVNVEIEIVDMDLVGTKFTVWRMKPLWDDDVDYLFCRDIDYTPLRIERQAVEYFTYDQNYCVIHGIRSHPGHTTILMAGMCGFNASIIRKEIKIICPDFNSYVKYGQETVQYCIDGWWWGCDQMLLRDFFGKNNYIPRILDCPQFSAPSTLADVNWVTCGQSNYDNIDICDPAVGNFTSGLARYTGEAWHSTPEITRNLFLLVDNDTKRIVEKFIINSGFKERFL